MSKKRIRCDVLVVGAGGAGLRAALAAKEKNKALRVLLVTKGTLGKAGVTANACSDRMAFHVTLPWTPPGGKDAWKPHADDIYRIGGYVSDGTLAKTLARGSADAYFYLDRIGVPFVKEGRRPVQFVTDGSDYPRACFTGPYTAVDIAKALVKELKKTDIEVLESHLAAKLLTDSAGKKIRGAILMKENAPRPQVTVVEARAVILATGGGGGIFRTNVYPQGMTGDAYSLAYDVGAPLVNMEFIQIGLSSVKTKLACSGSFFRAVPRLANSDEDEFLARHFPSDFARTDLFNLTFKKGASWPASFEQATLAIDLAVFTERLAGRKTYLDLSRNPSGFHFERLSPEILDWYKKRTGSRFKTLFSSKPIERLRLINPQAIQWLKDRGLDLEKGEPVEIAPAAQHFMGGVKINGKAETAVKNLFACGECAGGQHGANRPGGNALMDSQVFGKVAGEHAAAAAARGRRSKIPQKEIREFEKGLKTLKRKKNSIAAREVKRELGRIMDEAAGVLRMAGRIDLALQRIEQMKTKTISAPAKEMPSALEARGMLTVAEAVLRAARMREESRGSHIFFGHDKPLPRNDRKWKKYIVITKTKKGMQLKPTKPKALRT
jgi:succinate dehydrogenase / fumarate reductase flavoprotein subunit